MIWPLRRAVGVAPRAEAVRFDDVALTYAQTWERCRRLAGALRALGLQRGDRVAVVARNSHRYLELYQAVPGAGFVLVPLNHRHADAELRYAIEDAGARVLFADRAVSELPACVEHVVDAAEGHEELIAAAEPVCDFPDDPGEDDLAGIFYTGGTTGGAKGVMLRHRALVSNAMHVQAVWPFEPETCFLLVAPMFHLAGTLAVLPCVWHAARQVVMPGFDAAGAARPLAAAPRARSSCRGSTRRRRSTSSRPKASPRRRSCRACSRRCATSSSSARATSRRFGTSRSAARRAPPRRCVALAARSPTPSS